MLPFWISIGALSLVQGALVAIPGAGGLGALRRLRGRRWAVIPPLSVIGFVFVARGAEQASAQGLTYLALVAVPLLAALALGWLAWNAHPPRPRTGVAGGAAVRAGLGRPRRPCRGGGGARAVGAQLCLARRAARGGDAPALAGRGDRGDGGGGHDARRLGSAAAAEQRAQRRAPGGRLATAAERRVRHGGDRLRRPVRRGPARCAARGCAWALVADARRGARGIAGGGLRPAVLLRR